MKKEFNLLLTTILLFISFSTLTAQIESSDCPNYSGYNFEAYISSEGEVADIAYRAACFYEDRFITIDGGENAGGVNRAFVELVTRNLLIAETTSEDYSFVMSPTSLEYYIADQVEEESYNLIFNMVNSHTNCTEFEAVYLDYELAYRTSESFATSEFSFGVDGSYSRKLYVVKALCGEYRSGLFIIIIDKDAHLQSSIFVIPGDIGDPETVPGTIGGSLIGQPGNVVEGFSTYPNPVDGDFSTVEFVMENSQTVTLSMVEASTGKVVQSSQEYIEKGSHKQDLEMKGLAAGIYYVVLQTEDGRMVERIVKM